MVKFTLTYRNINSTAYETFTFDTVYDAENFAFEAFVNGEVSLDSAATVVVEDDENPEFLKRLIRIIEPNLVFDEDGAMDISGFTVKGFGPY